MDPLEKMRRQIRNTLETKLGLLQTKLDSARDPKNRTQRKIYVGNLISSMDGEFLKKLFTHTLKMGYPQWNINGQDFVVEVQYRDGNKYCFLEFRTIEMASAALQVNGVYILGSQIHVSRSIGYLDPIECEKAVKEAEYNLSKYRVGEDEGQLLCQTEFIELVNRIKNVDSMPNDDITMLSPFLSFDNIVTSCSLDSDKEIRDIYEDLKAKASEYGKVVRVVIPRPSVGVNGIEVLGKLQYGKAFVQFDKIIAAEKAKKALNGIIFDGRLVNVKTTNETTFIKALGI